MRSYRHLWIGIFLCFCHSASAQLQWESKEIAMKASVGQTNVVARFHFKNIGTNLVKINSVETCCSCTTANLEKKNYLAGESGEIVVHFEFGERVGVQKKTILVSSDSPQSPTVLRLQVEIPESKKTEEKPADTNQSEKNKS
jgi:hypothetical protein